MTKVSKIKIGSDVHNINDTGAVHSSSITNIVRLTESEYAALLSKDDSVFYIVDPDPILTPTFGGLEIAPAPLYYNGTTYEIKDNDWNHDSYNSVYGKNAGSYYHSFIELGQYFDSDGSNFSRLSGDIDNANTISYNGHDDWRIPTVAELCTLTSGEEPGTSRSGSSVNGVNGAKFAIIRLSDVLYDWWEVYGILLFPDGFTITGATLNNINVDIDDPNYSEMTSSELQAYINQGCAFLPEFGMFGTNWYNYSNLGAYPSSNSTDDYEFKSWRFDEYYATTIVNDLKENVYYTVRLVRTAQ